MRADVRHDVRPDHRFRLYEDEYQSPEVYSKADVMALLGDSPWVNFLEPEPAAPDEDPPWSTDSPEPISSIEGAGPGGGGAIAALAKLSLFVDLVELGVATPFVVDKIRELQRTPREQWPEVLSQSMHLGGAPELKVLSPWARYVDWDDTRRAGTKVSLLSGIGSPLEIRHGDLRILHEWQSVEEPTGPGFHWTAERISGDRIGVEWPAWMQSHIHSAGDTGRRARIGFAMAIWFHTIRLHKQARKEQAENGHVTDWLAGRVKTFDRYSKPNDVNMRPDDPFWKATEERRKDHATFVREAARFHWTSHTVWDFNPVHAFKSAAKWAGHAWQTAEHAVSKVPVLGPVLHATLAVTPFELVANVASGQRLDHAFMNDFKAKLGAARDVAPYVETVVSFVPGVGTGVSAAMAAGAVLAEGRPITEAVMSAMKAAIPGGPAAQAGFEMARRVVRGENVGKAALQGARAALPKEAQAAFDIGLAAVTGQKLQLSVLKALGNLAPPEVQALVSKGTALAKSVPALAEARGLVGKAAGPLKGFDLASGLLTHQAVNEASLLKVRHMLPPEGQKGFDAAVAAHARRFGDMAQGPLKKLPGVGLVFAHPPHSAEGLTHAGKVLDAMNHPDPKKAKAARRLAMRTMLAAKAGHPDAKVGLATLRAAETHRKQPMVVVAPGGKIVQRGHLVGNVFTPLRA